MPPALAGLPKDAILDGEIVAWVGWSGHPARAAERSPQVGRALPFSTLQQRLGRKKVSDKPMRDVPVAYLVFDVLYAGGELLLDRPLRERAQILDDLLAAPRTTLCSPVQAQSSSLFDDRCRTLLRSPCFALRSRSPYSSEDLEELFPPLATAATKA